MPRKTRIFLLTTFIVLTLLTLFHSNSLYKASSLQPLPPANATLGFGTILAVSRPHSRRQASLLWAVNLTDLSIVIPPQPAWTEADLRAFRLDKGSTISNDSALAWLGHLHALQHFLSTSHGAALIIEDDVDFDLTIRTRQIPLLAASVRSLLSAHVTLPLAEPTDYWGPTNQWDILYPDHCDDTLPPSSLSSPLHPLHAPHAFYTDTTVPLRALLHPDTSHFLHALRVPCSTRLLHRSFAPFCTFAYGVTRRSADLVLRRFSREEEGVGAFDVRLLGACREELRCFSVSPELFHHVDGGSEIAGVDQRDAWIGDGQEVEMRGLGKGTWNVGCGARHEQLWVREGDADGRSRARDVVRGMLKRGRGECPIDFVKAERGWKGCEWGECGAQS